MKISNHFIFYWLIFLILVFIGSTLPSLAPTEKYHFDKVAHFLAYFLLSFFPAIFLKRRSILFLNIIFLLGISITIEVIQTHIPGRMGSIEDAAVNMIGILIGSICGVFIISIIKKQ